MYIYIVLVICMMLVGYLLIIRNNLIQLDNKVDEAFSTMDIYLKKRWDLIPNIVDSVKGYAKYEKNVLDSIINIRIKSYDSIDINDKIEVNSRLTGVMNNLMIIVESYPELKANENFRDLTKQLTKVEEDIANARKYYNGVVRLYNNKIEMFPSNIVAKLFGYQTKKMFSINTDERENIEVNFEEKL